MRRTRVLAAMAAVVATIWSADSPPAVAQSRPRGDVRVLALIPPPGYPALPHLVADKIFEGTYDNPNGSPLPSRVLEYTSGGELLNSWTVAGQDVSRSHGIQVAANDAQGRLFLLDKTSGRIIELNPRTGVQTLYGSVPHIPPCSSAPPGTECKQSTQDLDPMPDYAAWGIDGSLYVTDYQQAAIWRVPRGGGTAQLWLTDKRLDGGQFGTACILLMPDHHTLLFDQASNGGLGSLDKVANALAPTSGSLNPTTGKLYEVPITSSGHPGALQQLWESGPADAPDGCALTTSGHVFVALAGASNQIVELDASGHELARFGQQFSGNNNSSVPLDTPSGLACLGTHLIIANQSYLAGNQSNQALLDMESAEACASVFVPGAPAHKATPKHKHRRISRRARVRSGFTG